MTSHHPLAGPALGLAAGIALGLQGVPRPSALPVGLALAFSPVLAPAGFACAGWLLARPAVAGPAATPLERDVEGRVASVPERTGDRVRFRLATAEGPLDAFAFPAPWPLALGDRIRMRALLRSPAAARNPGGRDPAGRLAAGGIALQA